MQEELCVPKDGRELRSPAWSSSTPQPQPQPVCRAPEAREHSAAFPRTLCTGAAGGAVSV